LSISCYVHSTPLAIGGTNVSKLPESPLPPPPDQPEFLSNHLSKEIPPDSTLRYQLLHRTVSAVLEAQLHGAVAAVVLVHAFGREAADNLSDFSEFLTELGGTWGDERDGFWPLSAWRAT